MRSYNERTLRESWWHFVSANRGPLLLLAVGWTGLLVLEGWLLDGYMAGFMQGLLLATGPLLCYLGFLLISGQSLRLSGKWGEDNTRDVLKTAARRRTIYGHVDNLEIVGGDVDHLVVAPWGIVAIDSKWHAHGFTPTTVANDAERAQASARRARSILRSLHHHSEVIPAVVIWGGEQTSVPSGGLRRGDVHFVAGRDLRLWLKRMAATGPPTLTRTEAAKLLRALRHFRRTVRPA